MHTKNYYPKQTEYEGLENLAIEERHIQTEHKVNKYYSNNDDATIKKKLIDHYEKVQSTHDTNYYHNDTLLNQLQESIHSYRPVFKEKSVTKKPNYTSLSLQIQKPQIITIQQQAYIEEPQQITFTQQQVPSVKKRQISRLDRQISALYKQNRNINLQYRKRKFMQIFLKVQQN